MKDSLRLYDEPVCKLQKLLRRNRRRALYLYEFAIVCLFFCFLFAETIAGWIRGSLSAGARLLSVMEQVSVERQDWSIDFWRLLFLLGCLTPEILSSSLWSLAAVKKRKDHWVETAAGRYLHSARLFLVSNFHILLLETCGDRLFIFFSFFCLTGCPSLRKI